MGRLNTDERGELIGNFKAEDKVIVFYKDGSYELTSFEVTNRYEAAQVLFLTKFQPEGIVNAVHMDGGSKTHYIKRFVIETTTLNKRFPFVSEAKNSKLSYVSIGEKAPVKVVYKEKNKRMEKELNLEELIDPKGWKAIGNKFPVQGITKVEPIASEEPMPPAEDKPAVQEGVPNIEQLKDAIRHEVEEEEKQLGLFGGKKE